jgi:Co/Zn/Cd efflux system component
MASAATTKGERGTLRILLALNAVMFCVEIVAGWAAESAGLIADSLDMFADAAVYGVSLYAVGKAEGMRMRAARLSGYLQVLLAVGALGEVLRRLVVGSEPQPPAMIGIALLALAVNVACMALIAKHREGGVHMRASWIFSTNDVLANLGVMAAAALVAWTGSRLPDLVIGAVIAAVVFSGGLRILALSRSAARP